MKILFHPREKMLKGLDCVANAVGGTLGPKGLNGIIKKPYENIITNDGATIASSIELEGFEDFGAQMVRNVSSKTNDDCGDGTTTTAILLQSLIHECVKRPENPMEIRESLLKASKEAVEKLKAKSSPATKEDVISVAKVSSENDTIANLVMELVSKLGEKAVINVDDSRTAESSAEVIPGYDAPVGFVSPHFVNDKATGKAVFENVHVLVSEKKISSLTDIKRISELFEGESISQCVIVCEDIDDTMIGLFAVNNAKGIFKSVIVKARGEILEDIEGAVGAKAVSDRNGVSFQNITLEDLGKCKKVSVDINKSLFLGTTISGGLRASELEGLAESEENYYRKQKLLDRAAKLRGGIGVLKIGSDSDYERTYLKLKAEDAIKAVQSAQEEGIVEGGGMALWRTAKELKSDTVGQKILKTSLQAPLKKLMENSGEDYATALDFLGNYGYDAKKNQYCNLKEEGIIDPLKVERCALENAVSAASQFITTFVAVK